MSGGYNKNTIKRTPKPSKKDCDCPPCPPTVEFGEGQFVKICRMVDGTDLNPEYESGWVVVPGLGAGGGLSKAEVEQCIADAIEGLDIPSAQEICDIVQPKIDLAINLLRDDLGEYQAEVSTQFTSVIERLVSLEECVNDLKGGTDLPPACIVGCEPIKVGTDYNNTVVYTLSIPNKDPAHTYSIEFFSDENGANSLGSANPQMITYDQTGNYCIWARVTDETTGLTSDHPDTGALCKSDTCSITVPANEWSGAAGCAVDDCMVILTNNVSHPAGITSYAWSYGATDIGTNSSETYEPTENILHEFCLEVTNGLGETNTFKCQEQISCVVTEQLPVCNGVDCVFDKVTGELTVTVDADNPLDPPSNGLVYDWTLTGGMSGSETSSPFIIEPTLPYAGGTLSVTVSNDDGSCDALEKTVPQLIGCPTVDDFDPTCNDLGDGCYEILPGTLPDGVIEVCATSDGDQLADGFRLPSIIAGAGTGTIITDDLEPIVTQYYGAVTGSQLPLDSGSVGVFPQTMTNGTLTVDGIYGSERLGQCQISVITNGLNQAGDMSDITINGTLYSAPADDVDTQFLPGDTIYSWNVPCADALALGSKFTVSGDNWIDSSAEAYSANPCNDGTTPLVMKFETGGNKTGTLTYTFDNGCDPVEVPFVCGLPVQCTTFTGGQDQTFIDFPAGSITTTYCGMGGSTGVPASGQIEGADIVTLQTINVGANSWFLQIELDGLLNNNYFDSTVVEGVQFDTVDAAHGQGASTTTWTWSLTEAEYNLLSALCTSFEVCDGGATSIGGKNEGKSVKPPELFNSCNPCFEISPEWVATSGADAVVLQANDGFNVRYTMAQVAAGELCYTAIAGNFDAQLGFFLVDASDNILSSDLFEYDTNASCQLDVQCQNDATGTEFTW